MGAEKGRRKGEETSRRRDQRRKPENGRRMASDTLAENMPGFRLGFSWRGLPVCDGSCRSNCRSFIVTADTHFGEGH